MSKIPDEVMTWLISDESNGYIFVDSTGQKWSRSATSGLPNPGETGHRLVTAVNSAIEAKDVESVRFSRWSVIRVND